MFTADDIRSRIRKTPFVPMRVLTTAGKSYDITHPRLTLVMPEYVYIGVASKEDPEIAETVDRVFLMYITDIQELPVTIST